MIINILIINYTIIINILIINYTIIINILIINYVYYNYKYINY